MTPKTSALALSLHNYRDSYPSRDCIPCKDVPGLIWLPRRPDDIHRLAPRL